MANPKKRHSPSRRDKRRANWKITAPVSGACPNCKAQVLPHRVCGACGFYNGKPVLTIKVKKSKQGEAPEGGASGTPPPTGR